MMLRRGSLCSLSAKSLDLLREDLVFKKEAIFAFELPSISTNLNKYIVIYLNEGV